MTGRRPDAGCTAMTHHVAKLLLRHTDTFLERSEAVKTALDLGMPLVEIEAYLDGLGELEPAGEQPQE